jgi:hypothetical protein
MCFSAEASFGSGVILSIAGTIALNNVKKPAQILFAGIPFLFAIQQFSEGFVWSALRDNNFGWWMTTASYVFLSFALLIWPVWVPLSVWMLEKNEKRKKILLVTLGAGIIFSMVLFICLINYPIKVITNYYHIDYNIEAPFQFPFLSRLLYLSATVFSLLSSSIQNVRWLGIVILLSYVISFVFFDKYTISVWCFFAAIASIFILLIIKNINKFEIDK